MFTVNGKEYHIDTDNQEFIELAKMLAEQDPESFPDGFRFFTDNLIEFFQLKGWSSSIRPE